MTKYSNTSAVPLSVAVFLATDNYDYNDDPNTISATSLIKPIRQIILSNRISPELSMIDLTQMVASRVGTAIHTAFESAWINDHSNALIALGYPDKIIKRVLVNPTEDKLFDGCIPVYLEQRSTKQVGRWNVSGKFDFVSDGRVEDVKTTSTYTAMNNTNDEKYILQGSIYRWLNPSIITQSDMAIQFIFTDWSKAKAMADPKYPQQRIQQRILPLKSILETHNFIERKLSQIDQYWDATEDRIPLCTDEDLWRSEPVFKYYKNPTKTTRSTKNFDTRQEALIRMAEDGNVGIVKEVPGQATACRYCNAFAACSQKDALIASGDLTL